MLEEDWEKKKFNELERHKLDRKNSRQQEEQVKLHSNMPKP